MDMAYPYIVFSLGGFRNTRQKLHNHRGQYGITESELDASLDEYLASGAVVETNGILRWGTITKYDNGNAFSMLEDYKRGV